MGPGYLLIIECMKTTIYYKNPIQSMNLFTTSPKLVYQSLTSKTCEPCTSIKYEVILL